MLTRTQVARRLGKSLATVRRLEGGQLHPHVDANGVHRFEVREVELLARRLHLPRVRARTAPTVFDHPDQPWHRQSVGVDDDAEEREYRQAAAARRRGFHLEEIARLTEQVRVLEQALAQEKAKDGAAAADDRRVRQRLRRELLDLRASGSERQIRRMGPELLDAVIEFLE